jgi:hypothetical protein
LEPLDAAPLYGCGAVAEGRPKKYFGSENGWPIRREPTSFSPSRIRLPFAASENSAWPMPVTTSG